MSDPHPIRTVLLGTLLALAAAVAPASVLAQTPTPAPTATATATPTPVVTPTPPPAPTTGPTRAQLESATYPVPAIPGGTATLVGGKFEVATAPGSASKATAMLVSSASGVIGGQPGAAVVLATSGGGSGTFFELYTMDAAAKPIARVSLGDRVAVSNISIGSTGLILVQLMAHGSTDPQCCPSIPQRRDYELQNGALVLVQTAVAQIQPPSPAATGTGGVNVAPNVAMSLAAVILGVLLVTCVAARGTTRRTIPIPRD